MIALTEGTRDALTIASIVISTLLAIIGIWLSVHLYRKNSLNMWKKRLAKRLKFIANHYPNGMDKVYTKNKNSQITHRKGFLLTSHAYWGYHRSGSASEYNFIIPFISLDMHKEHEGLYVWICIDNDGRENIKKSHLEELILIGKGGDHISDEILGSIERIKTIYEWYRHQYILAKKQKEEEDERKDSPMNPWG